MIPNFAVGLPLGALGADFALGFWEGFLFGGMLVAVGAAVLLFSQFK